MTIAFNCWILRNKNVDGIGNVIIETLSRMMKAHPDIKFLLLCDKNFTENYFDFPNATVHRIFPALRHPVLYVLFLETVLVSFLKKYRPDVFVGMDGMISLRSNAKQLSLICDLNFEHFPENLPLRNRVYYRYFFKRFAKKATRVPTISSYTKDDIVNLYKISSEKIDLITLGAKPIFTPLPTPEIVATRKKYTQGQPYFFFVGSMHARKNIQRLMLAFDAFKQQTDNNMKLVLAGNILWEADEIKAVSDKLKYKEDVVFSGRVSDADLKSLLGSAYALTFVPLFEGFGLPIVEAFQAGTAVICSNTTSMPEVAGDAAILVDPFQVSEITKAMVQLAGDENLRQSLIEKGNRRKVLFNWDTAAIELFESIQKAITN